MCTVRRIARVAGGRNRRRAEPAPAAAGRGQAAAYNTRVFIMDFEDAVAVLAPGGRRIGCVLRGLVEPDSPQGAGLGHSPLALADQSWRDLTLRAPETLDFEVGQLVFRDGSRRAAELAARGRDGEQHVYAVTLVRR